MPTLDITGSSDDPRPKVVRRRGVGPKRIRIVFTLLMFLVVVILLFASDFIPSKSMQPTLQPGDHIMVVRSWFAYPMNSMPSRGDIITFRIPVAQLDGPDAMPPKPASDPNADDPNAADSGEKMTFGAFFNGHPDTEVLIKRVIGLPGDKVLLKGNTIFINGKILKEDYQTIPSDEYANAMASYAVYQPLVVPPGELFVLGDNRNNSDDGRFWGTLKRKYVIGRFLHTLYNEGANGPNVLRAQSEQ
ncbi:MAG: signal peptidase bacterial type [Chthonomonadaceae bacterium]|nr:signal peptidase bacterial type [Chthonomonadaceae bacterium]